MTNFLCGECIHNSDKGGGCLIPKNLGYVDNCNHYLPKDRPIVQTNEEWFASLSTEEKARVLRRKIYGNGEDNEREEQGWVRWLQAKHEDNPPDIPSVPSWDRWLQGEKTKCELCDGSGKGVECNLVGRFECPKTPKTEQEYLQTCNTEQLAEFLCEVWCGIDEVINIMSEDGEINKKDAIVKWLKQPHTPKE